MDSETDTRVRSAGPDGSEHGPLPVEIIRSRKRKKTSSARIVDGVIQVRVPAWLSARDEARTVHDLVARVQKAHELAGKGPDLTERASVLAARYDLPSPTSIRWVTNQQHRWGSCTPDTAQIRISSRLRRVPEYVLDYVIVHELAHLVDAGHGTTFQALERRYPHCDRAEGFLEAMGLGAASPEHQAD